MSETATHDKDLVLGLQKGLAIISAFNVDRPRMSSAEAAEIVGITRAAARRSLLTLVHTGYARFDGKYFYLQPRILELGYKYLSSMKLPSLIQPVLDRISQETGESSSSAVLDGSDIVYIARSERKRLMAINIGVGTRIPAYCTSLGRAMLAFSSDECISSFFENAEFEKRTIKTVTNEREMKKIFERIRSDGYALNDEELEIGVRSLAVPIFDRNNKCVCAVNVSVSSARLTVDDMVKNILPIVLRERSVATYI